MRPLQLGFLLSLIPCIASGATLYIDGKLPQDCATYDPASRSCSGGSAKAFATLKGGAGAAQGGDVVEIRAGTYNEQLVSTASGASGKSITFRSYQLKEKAEISGLSKPALYIIGHSYITVEGLTVSDVQGWGRVESCQHCVIRANTFTKATATGTTGGLKLVKSSHLKILDNTFDDGNDNVVVQESDHNLLSGNTFIKGRHSLLSIRCSNHNVIRANSFDNPDQKAAEIYDCEGVSDAPVKLDATKRNLFEWNVFIHTKAHATKHYYYNGIQYAGQLGIVRRNVFYDNQGGALGIQVYPDEALHNYGHRIYNNTIYDCRCYGISASSDTSSKYHDIIVSNNLLYKNSDCSGGGGQTLIGNTTAVVLTNNTITTTAPPFANVAAHDFHLQKGSPLIDAGAFLTAAVGAGSGTKMIVADAAYFFDGNGIQGEKGDTIRLEGQTDTAQIASIDHAKKELTLSSPLTWTDGQKLATVFHGDKPDPGAFEHTPGGVKLDGGAPGDAGGDAGVNTDGTVTTGDSGTPGTDAAGDASTNSGTDDGCSCAVGRAPAPTAPLLLLLLLLGWVRPR